MLREKVPMDYTPERLVEFVDARLNPGADVVRARRRLALQG
jgi:hypothetical protein